jgi:uncharacterized protein YggE
MQRLILVLTTSLLVTGAAVAQTAANPPLITVAGQAEVKVMPDQVVFNLVVENVDKDLLAAKNLNDARAKSVLALAPGSISTRRTFAPILLALNRSTIATMSPRKGSSLATACQRP